MNTEFLSLIRCPVTGSPVTPAGEELLKRINDQIRDGELVNRIGQSVEAPLDGGCVNEAESLLIPIRKGVVILVADQAIEL